MVDILGKLFGSNAIVKILRLFLFNPEEAFEARDVVRRTKVDPDVVRAELSMLARIGFIKRKAFTRTATPPARRRTPRPKRLARRRVMGWARDEHFLFTRELSALLIGSTPLWSRDLIKRLRHAGNIKVIVISGVFVGDLDGRLDILIVGDNIKRRELSQSIRNIEAELGREIRYAVFSTPDFRYRLGIYDKLVRDVLDYRHETVIDRLGVIS